jgi:hypothetical protein
MGRKYLRHAQFKLLGHISNHEELDEFIHSDPSVIEAELYADMLAHEAKPYRDRVRDLKKSIAMHERRVRECQAALKKVQAKKLKHSQKRRKLRDKITSRKGCLRRRYVTEQSNKIRKSVGIKPTELPKLPPILSGISRFDRVKLNKFKKKIESKQHNEESDPQQ